MNISILSPEEANPWQKIRADCGRFGEDCVGELGSSECTSLGGDDSLNDDAQKRKYNGKNYPDNQGESTVNKRMKLPIDDVDGSVGGRSGRVGTGECRNFVVVVPGDVLMNAKAQKDEGVMGGHGTHFDQKDKNSSKLVATISGEVEQWFVDVGAAQRAHLSLQAINLPGSQQRRRNAEDVREMRNFFCPSDVISCEVQRIQQDGSIALHTRTARYGKLMNGCLVTVPSVLIERQSQHISCISVNVRDEAVVSSTKRVAKDGGVLRGGHGHQSESHGDYSVHDPEREGHEASSSSRILTRKVQVVLGMNGFIWISSAQRTSASDGINFTSSSQTYEKVDKMTRKAISLVRNCILGMSQLNLKINNRSINHLIDKSLYLRLQPVDLLQPKVVVDKLILSSSKR